MEMHPRILEARLDNWTPFPADPGRMGWDTRFHSPGTICLDGTRVRITAMRFRDLTRTIETCRSAQPVPQSICMTRLRRSDVESGIHCTVPGGGSHAFYGGLDNGCQLPMVISTVGYGRYSDIHVYEHV